MDLETLAQCKCGHIQFRTNEKPILQLCCHCADCRNATGEDASTIVFFKLDKVEISGELTAQKFISDMGNQTERLACADCGQVMFDKSAGFPNMLGVMAARLAAPFEAQPQMHVWTQSKLEQVNIPTNIKQYAKGIE